MRADPRARAARAGGRARREERHVPRRASTAMLEVDLDTRRKVVPRGAPAPPGGARGARPLAAVVRRAGTSTTGTTSRRGRSRCRAVMPDAPIAPAVPRAARRGARALSRSPTSGSSSEDVDTYVDITETIDTEDRVALCAARLAGGRGRRRPGCANGPASSARTGGVRVRGGVQDVHAARRRVGGWSVMEEPSTTTNANLRARPPRRRRHPRPISTTSAAMRVIFEPQGVKGVVIACQDCGENHYYEWDLLLENLEHMLKTGEPRMHEPAFEIREEEYIQWDYGKGYVDALADTGLEPDRRDRGHAVPLVRDAVRRGPLRSAPGAAGRCGRCASTGAARPRLRGARRPGAARACGLRALLTPAAGRSRTHSSGVLSGRRPLKRGRAHLVRASCDLEVLDLAHELGFDERRALHGWRARDRRSAGSSRSSGCERLAELVERRCR